MQGLDAGARHHAEVVFHSPCRGAEQPRVQAIGAADDRCQVAQIGQVHLAVGERFIDHRAGALEVIPLDLDALVGKGFFKDLLFTQHVGDATAAVLAAGTEVGHCDADFLEVGGMHQPGQGGAGEQADQTFKGQFHKRSSWWATVAWGAKSRHRLNKTLNTINSQFNSF